MMAVSDELVWFGEWRMARACNLLMMQEEAAAAECEQLLRALELKEARGRSVIVSREVNEWLHEMADSFRVARLNER